MAITIEAEELTLVTACDGILEQQFQEHLQTIRDTIALAENDPRRHETNKGRVKFKVTVELEIEHDVLDAITNVTGRTKLRLPPAKAVSRPARLRGHHWLVDPPAGVQQPLFDGPNRKDTPVRPALVADSQE
jgi:hypothetical protein